MQAHRNDPCSPSTKLIDAIRLAFVFIAMTVWLAFKVLMRLFFSMSLRLLKQCLAGKSMRESEELLCRIIIR